MDGPFFKTAAASVCSCQPKELCPGPLAGIDEGDKIGGANGIIQKQTEERTVAQALHWVLDGGVARACPQQLRSWTSAPQLSSKQEAHCRFGDVGHPFPLQDAPGNIMACSTCSKKPFAHFIDICGQPCPSEWADELTHPEKLQVAKSDLCSNLLFLPRILNRENL